MDDVVREMEKMIEKQLEELSKRTPGDLVRERTLPDGSKAKELGPFVYGCSVKIGPEGRPQIREFGNIRTKNERGRPHLDIKEKREPLADVMTINSEVKVIVELPGVDKKDIKLYGTENTLTISVDTHRRKYYKKMELPAKVDPKRAESSYKNGVLEVTLKKKEEEKPRGELINIE